MNNYEKLQQVLTEIFEMDKADLDFGIYRIMNQKRREVEEFINKKLPEDIKTILAETGSKDTVVLKDEMDKLGQSLDNAGVARETSPKYLDLQQRIAQAIDTNALEQDIFSHLANFFKRYYKEGDFISQRQYKKGVYAIPYEGEEVKLYWANYDQYYIKTSEYLKNYAFKIAGGKKIHFRLKEASTEQNNNKSQNNQERRFAIFEELPLEVESDELYINLTYEPHSKSVKQADLAAQAIKVIQNYIPVAFASAFEKAPTAKDKNRTLLEKHLNNFISRNTFDYFIHKDLGGFLHRELDFYIKNEVLFIDDIDTENPAFFTAQLSKIKAMKTVAGKIITFLAQIENFQKKLWLKKKFVIRTDYCITLDRIPEKYYSEIWENKAQLEEWEKLGFDYAQPTDSAQPTGGDDLSEDIPGGSLAFAREERPKQSFTDNPYLVLDTQFFSEEFKDRLLGEFDNLDEETDGLLINSENFQALNLMQEKYREKVKMIYIDPPYNAQSSEILYKNIFKHSSWISLMENRISLSKLLLKSNFVTVIAIDEIENFNLGKMLEIIFPDCENSTISIVHNPTGQQGNNFSFTHEFAHFIFPKNGNFIGLENRMDSKREAKPDIRPLRNVSSGKAHLRESAANCFYPILIKNDKIIGFGNVCPKDFHPRQKNVEKGNGIIEVFPIDPSNIESKWVFAGTTGHATIKLNREDGGKRKYILVEMGAYFNTVTKPRIQKVIYSDNWKGGKPQDTEGITQMFKYQVLESYEDTLNNLSLKTNENKELFSEASQEEYLLKYMLDIESREQLCDIDLFRNPFNYQLKVTENNELKPTKVDLVETFNYLIGLYVERIQRVKDIKFVEGKTREGEKTLVIWRNLDTTDNAETQKVFRKIYESPKSTEFDQIYINGDHHFDNMHTGEDRFKVKLIEETFFKRMFGVEEL